MCVTASIRTMGCGKSRHHSPDDSEADLKHSSGSGSNYNRSGNKVSGGKNERKKLFNAGVKKRKDKAGDNEIAERSPSYKKITNGKTRIKDRNEEIGYSLSSSPGSRAGASSSSSSSSPGEDPGDRSNGATKLQNRNFLLEVPNEISKVDSTSRTTHRELKTLTTTKTIHITSSQLEFFKMLDEKIEMGCDYQTSNDASEVSSLNEASKQ